MIELILETGYELLRDMPQKYTILDIAKTAGVSRGTVSRVLNNHPSVSDQTRQKVLEVIKRLDYSPNFSARSLRTAASNMVGFATDEVITTPFAVDIIRGAQDTLSQYGKVMIEQLQDLSEVVKW